MMHCTITSPLTFRLVIMFSNLCQDKYMHEKRFSPEKISITINKHLMFFRKQGSIFTGCFSNGMADLLTPRFIQIVHQNPFHINSCVATKWPSRYSKFND